jgi:hypothetical protein
MNNRNSILYWICMLAVWMLLATGLAGSEPANPVELFRSTLKNADHQAFRSLIHPSGLILVRLYNRGSGETDIAIKLREIPGNFQVAVGYDFPFDFRYLFGGTIRSRSLIFLKEPLLVGFAAEEPLAAIREHSRMIVESINQRIPSFTPTVVELNDGWIALSEAESSRGLLSGALAFFENVNGSYYLRMVIDMR